MAELTPKERLQPSLLDRLADDDPTQTVESREQRVLSLARLRQSVNRDLEWLLNTACLETIQSLDDYPHVRQSVLNFGIPDLTGTTISNADPSALERYLRQAILTFEPRILKRSLKVRAKAGGEHNQIVFEIEGELWAQPLPEHLYLRTILDLELGRVDIEP
ncbi:MAG: type VI secretion system baseplate subunit TssE [Desulfosarcina sp.]|nr:type VI secretion system baseplate subunit TssE [Desulfosarcina sp.]